MYNCPLDIREPEIHSDEALNVEKTSIFKEVKPISLEDAVFVDNQPENALRKSPTTKKKMSSRRR